ncbi:hypothetical protein ACFC0M_06280 [Streptomyces sp. NPDC056149]|uniref:hypothetical protein n=1 Tax=unclassified Streptomyces TaxID=2593676 RepID=UPI0023810AD5|nr:hypothetical protein [Streptomyces sp. WZ-12]
MASALLLTASEAAWLVRDLAVLRHPAGLSGGDLGAATAVYDPLLAATGLAAARTARRGTATAPGALLSLATATALLRLPVLWLPDPPPGTDGTPAAWARATAVAQLVLAGALLAVACGLGGLCAAALPGAPDDAADGRRPVVYGDGPDEPRPRGAPRGRLSRRGACGEPVRCAGLSGCGDGPPG